jgi:hypothetical protein
LPEFFRPILWSYNFSAIDSEKDKKIIITNAINYGDLKHWRWLVLNYGKNGISKVLKKIPATALRPAARRLASTLFSIKNFNYVLRGVER